MKFKNMVLAGAAALMAASAPAVAADAGTRAAPAVEGEENLGGASLIVALLAIIAVILGILAAIDDDETVSP